jgi:hypothetical protein
MKMRLTCVPGPLKLSSIWQTPQHGTVGVQLREQPICQDRNEKVSGTKAPQFKQDGTPSIQSVADEFCCRMDCNTVTEGGSPEYQFNTYELSSFWTSAAHRKDAPTSLKCGKDVKTTKADCVEGLMSAVSRCKPFQKFTHGAAIDRGCVKYVCISISSMSALLTLLRPS